MELSPPHPHYPPPTPLPPATSTPPLHTHTGQMVKRGNGEGVRKSCRDSLMNDPWYAGSQYPQIITTKGYAWQGLHWSLSGKESTCQCRRHRFNLWVKKIPWRRKWQPTPVFCLGNPMGRGVYWATVHGGHKRVRQNLIIKQQMHDKCRSSPNWLQHEREAKSHQKAGVTIMLGAKGVVTLLF